MSGRLLRLSLSIVLALVVAGALPDAKVKIRTEHDKTYSFKGIKTWAWSRLGVGDVKMLLTAEDDPEAVRRRFEPIIVEAIASEMGRRGLVSATGYAADVEVRYYLLISLASSSQQMGQFLPATAAWGLPPFGGQTTSLRAIEQGSLVVDVAAPKLDTVVWRSVAQTEIDRQKTDVQRAARIREAVRDMLSKFPPK
jgi:hypothetical protein